MMERGYYVQSGSKHQFDTPWYNVGWNDKELFWLPMVVVDSLVDGAQTTPHCGREPLVIEKKSPREIILSSWGLDWHIDSEE